MNRTKHKIRTRLWNMWKECLENNWAAALSVQTEEYKIRYLL